MFLGGGVGRGGHRTGALWRHGQGRAGAGGGERDGRCEGQGGRKVEGQSDQGWGRMPVARRRAGEGTRANTSKR